MAKGLKGKLKKMQSAWESAEPREGGFSLADGTFNAKIEGATIEESQNERLQIVWELRFLSGENSGRTARKFSGLDTEENIAWAKGDLTRFGIELPEDIVELGDALAECVGAYVECTVKTKDEYTNIYFNEVVEGVEEEEEEDIDFEGMSKKELIEFATEYGIKIPKKTKAKEDKLREFVEEAYNELPEEEEDEEEEEEEEEDESEDSSDEEDDEEEEDSEDSEEDEDEDSEEEEESEEEDLDLDELDKDGLVQVVRDYRPKGLTVTNAKKMTTKALRKKLATLLSE